MKRVGNVLRDVIERADRHRVLGEVQRHIALKEAAKLAAGEEQAEEAIHSE